jgi:protein O-mannosyl-transferase
MKKPEHIYPDWIYALLPVAFAFILYSNTIPNKYCLDDYCVIVNNTYVQDGLHGIPKLLSTNFFNGFNGFNDGLYRPLPMVTYAIEFTFFGLNPHVSHAVNILFFAIAGFVLFLLVKRLCGAINPVIPLAMVMLYMAHPVHTEVVGSIKGRDELLAFLFGILAMYFFIRYTTKPSVYLIIAGFGSYILSLLSKENSLMFLFVIPLMVLLFTKTSVNRQIFLASLLAVITVAWLFLRYIIIHSMPNPVDQGIFTTLNNSITSTNDMVSRLATAVYLQFLYIAKLIVPFPLSHDYSYNQIPPIGISSIQFLVSLIVLGLAGAAIVFSFKRNKLIFFSILFYFLTIATASNIVVYIGATFAERFLFTPSFGFSVISGSLLALLIKKVKVKDSLVKVLTGNIYFTFAFTLVLITYSVITIGRNYDWKDNLTLYTKDVNRSANSARAHYNYGSELMARSGEENDKDKKTENLNKAAFELKKAVAIYPGYLDAFNNLGNVYTNLNQRDSAVLYYARTIKLDSNYMKGYFNLGINYYSMGKFPDAIPLLEKYARFSPGTPQIFYYIGNSYGSMGKFDEAIFYLDKNLEVHGEDMETLILLGKAYGFKGQLQKSIEIFNRALKIDINNKDVLFNLGLTYNYLGEPAKSIDFFQKAIKADPGSLPSYIELANAYDRLGKHADAAMVRASVSQLHKNQ